MTLVLPNVGEIFILNLLANKSSAENMTLRLFKSNTTPAEGDTLATYTEATFTGYAGIALTGADWTVTSGAPSDMQTAAKDFTSSVLQTLENVYGYHLSRATGPTLVWAERFTSAPYPIENLNDIIRITAKFTVD